MATSRRKWWFARPVDACRRRAARIDRAAAAWVAVLTVACCVAVARAEADAACWRCAKWVKLPEWGFGFIRGWEGLCGACKDPARRCDEALKDLERTIAEVRDLLGYQRVSLKQKQEAYAVKRDTGIGQFPGGSFEIAFLESSIRSLEERLAELLDHLGRMKAECGARGGGGAGGAADAAADMLRAGAKGVASQLWSNVETMYGRAKVMNELIAAGASKIAGPAQKATAAPTAAAQLDAIVQYMGTFVETTEAPAPAGSVGSEATAEGSPAASQERIVRPAAAGSETKAGKPPAASQEEIIVPTLVDMDKDLPESPVAKGFDLSQRHTANAAAYAEALEQSAEQVDAARAAGDPKRAHTHLERAAFLAVAGQKELRQAVAERTAAIRTLYKAGKSFEEQAKGKGKTVEEALASWQAEVRANGLPAEYVAELKTAGLSEEQIAKRREWLQSADPKAAAQTHAQFVGTVAPLYLPEARGKEEGTPLPEADDLWDLVTIQLLHTEHPVPQPEAAKTEGSLLPILGGVAVVLLIVLVYVLRRRAAPLA